MTPVWYSQPYGVKFWIAELFHRMPDVRIWRGIPKHSPQELFDLWHSLEDGIENQSRPEQRRRLKWMLILELSISCKLAADNRELKEDEDA